MVKNLKLTFCSGAGSVTGANFLLEGGDQGAEKKFLIDCGLLQGTKLADDENWKTFSYDPKGVDILFITHAHIDHIGRIPKLIYEGFSGEIYSTPATKALAEYMLLDTVNILGRDEENGLNRIYNEKAVHEIMALWKTLPYHQTLNLSGGFKMTFHDAGHILGSSMLSVVYNEKKILFTGDLGNSPSPLLPDTEIVTDADYLIMESVYGDRNHESRDERKKLLENAIEDNFKKKGTLMIPIFSLERAQEILFEMNDLVENHRIPRMPIFLDSPLAIRLTGVYKQFESYLNEDAQKIIKEGDDIFSFPGLTFTVETEESKHISKTPDPKIILAGSGMSNGGRIIHHERHYLPNPKNTILLLGYQALGTPGRVIQSGARNLRIFGEDVPIRAKIVTIGGYSGHKDSDALLDFVSKMADNLKKVYVVMGEPKSSLFFVQRLRDYLGVNAEAPETGDSVIIEC